MSFQRTLHPETAAFVSIAHHRKVLSYLGLGGKGQLESASARGHTDSLNTTYITQPI
jgi:hypothetical protein